MLNVLIMPLPSPLPLIAQPKCDRKCRLCLFAVSCPTTPSPPIWCRLPNRSRRTQHKSTWSGHITPFTHSPRLSTAPNHSVGIALSPTRRLLHTTPTMTPTAAAAHPLPASMLAGVADHHGDRFDMRQVPVKAPGPGQALVKIVTSGVCHVSRRFRFRVRVGRGEAGIPGQHVALAA